MCAFDDILSPPDHLPPNIIDTHTHTQGFIRLAVFLYSPAAASPWISTTTNERMLSWNTESLEGKPTALLKYQQASIQSYHGVQFDLNIAYIPLVFPATVLHEKSLSRSQTVASQPGNETREGSCKHV